MGFRLSDLGWIGVLPLDVHGGTREDELPERRLRQRPGQ